MTIKKRTNVLGLDNRLPVLMTSKQRAALDAYAAKNGRNASAQVRIWIDHICISGQAGGEA